VLAELAINVMGQSGDELDQSAENGAGFGHFPTSCVEPLGPSNAPCQALGGGQILLVKPSYRSYWLIPGGLVERDEPPWLAARREAKEEIGIDVGELRFIGMDWRPTDDEYDDSLHFLFDGGTLSEDQIAAIKCDGTEIVDYQFATRDDVDKLLDPHLARRIIACWRGQLDRPMIMNGGKPDQTTV
jgi:8-oxo-dGTP pyrophosphatase MutT (NUDIX family)